MKPIIANADESRIASLLSSKVPLGINLVFYGLELTALAIILMTLLPFAISGGINTLIMLIRIIQFLGYVVVAASILSLTGKVMCLSAPDEMEGKNAIYGAVSLNLLVILLGVAGLFLSMPPFVSLLSSLLTITAFTCFLLFLLRLGRLLGNEDLANGATGLLKLLFALMVVFMLTFASRFLPFPPVVILPLGAATLILAVIGLIRYSRLLLNFKKVLARKKSQN